MKLSNAWVVAAVFVVIAVAMTWPLASVMNHELAPDLGDPLFICWVLMWTGGQVLSALRGNVNALHDFWNGNIFAPERLTIAYSEHFSGQLLQILPIYAATGNIVLCYNLLFLSTFVVAGLGMYLLVRELTNRPLAAFLAGLAFAFAPYRLSQLPHLQLLSTGWMPLALYGFRRFFVTGRRRPLAGAAAALTMQNLSCGYYLLFFPPFVAAYALYEMAHRGLLRQWKTWRSLVLAAAAVGVLTWPFVSPYFQVRRESMEMGRRSYDEAVQFSADTYAFGTVSQASRFWRGHFAAFPKGEGEGFLGLAILTFAGIGVAWGLRRWAATLSFRSLPRWRVAAAIGLAALFAVNLAGLLTLFINGRLPFLFNGHPWRDTDPFLIGAFASIAAALVVVPAARRLGLTAFFAAAAVVSALLALGPRIMSQGRPLGSGPFYWLMAYVPGFDGIRVPSRFLMLAAMFLAVLAGLGAAALIAWRRRLGGALVIAGAAFILAESWMSPLDTNIRIGAQGFLPTTNRLYLGEEVSSLYKLVRDAPPKSILIEFPFGEPAYDIQAVFYAGVHRRPLVNGYSGFFPESYLKRATFLGKIPFDFDAATRALASTYATHAIVHEGAFTDNRGHIISDWLTSLGAKFVASDYDDKLFQLK